ncbi:N-acetylmuramoyl-L-alanine amidase [Calothrix sp. 336/3]|uniref:N-acetylmuramoyl-L-alanine amidase n=1 Tax=Calothrix sp. 336/3 TaxID=1337936 RepID=UPI001EDEABE5|nr:N-acetylmuramoyl-L-alanine amidase [Calothrix sp. 336/3]
MMKIAIDLGHGCPPDSGAVGIRTEEEMINAVGRKLIDLLKGEGHELVLCRPSGCGSVGQSLRRRVKTANDAKVDFYVSLHFNAFNGKANGTECFAIGGVGRAVAEKVVGNIARLGFVNRGVKDGSRLFVVRNTSMPAILVEGCFCDSPADIAIYEPESMAHAIFEAIS